MVWPIESLLREIEVFFSITKQPDQRFPNCVTIGKMYFNSDDGWQKNIENGCVIFYKGYLDNFCKVIFNDSQARIQHNTYRNFPLWYDQHCVTNLPRDGLRTAWLNDRLILNAGNWVTVDKVDLDLTVPAEYITIDHALKSITQRLDFKVQWLKTNMQKPIKLFCSGGTDTALLYALFNYHNVEYDLILHDHYDLDEFTSSNQSTLKEFWAYQQIHHWKDHTWLATGSCGDEYFLRGPIAISIMTAWHDINFAQILNQHPDCYHYHHFLKKKAMWKLDWESRQKLKSDYNTRTSLVQQILNILANDHQHWHLGNTLTWTPFNDIEIPRTLLQCRIEDLIPQFLDGQFTKKLIQHYDSSAIKLISQYKNLNPQENLAKFFAKSIS